MPAQPSVKALLAKVKKEKEKKEKAAQELLGDPTEKEMKRPISRYSRGPRLTKEAYEEKKKATATARRQKEARTVVESMMNDISKK